MLQQSYKHTIILNVLYFAVLRIPITKTFLIMWHTLWTYQSPWFAEIDVDVLMNPDINLKLTLTEHLQDKIETQTAPQAECCCALLSTNPHSHAPKSSGRPRLKTGGRYNSNSLLMNIGFVVWWTGVYILLAKQR